MATGYARCTATPRKGCGREEETPKPGIHWLYYRPESDGNKEDGNKVLARRPKTHEEYTDKDQETIAIAAKRGKVKVPPKVLIETRGEGGYIVLAPSYFDTSKPYTLKNHRATRGRDLLGLARQGPWRGTWRDDELRWQRSPLRLHVVVRIRVGAEL
jgi:hypothetical protein